VEIKRKPHQIVLIEHIFYSVVGFIFFVLAASYGPKVAAIYTELQPKDIYEITIATGASILAIITIFAFPYSCIRLWKSTNLNLNGFWKVASKSYAALLFTACILYGLLMLISLPGLYVAAFNI